jgi:hypothetical protein
VYTPCGLQLVLRRQLKLILRRQLIVGRHGGCELQNLALGRIDEERWHGGSGLRNPTLGRIDEEGESKRTTNFQTESGRLERLRRRLRTLEENIDVRTLLNVRARSASTGEIPRSDDPSMLQEIMNPRETNEKVHLANLEESCNFSTRYGDRHVTEDRKDDSRSPTIWKAKTNGERKRDHIPPRHKRQGGRRLTTTIVRMEGLQSRVRMPRICPPVREGELREADEEPVGWPERHELTGYNGTQTIMPRRDAERRWGGLERLLEQSYAITFW